MPVKVYLRERLRRMRSRRDLGSGTQDPGPEIRAGGLLQYLLQVLCPVGWFRHGHEAAVGQDGAHDEEAEQGAAVQENHHPTSHVAMGTAGGGARGGITMQIIFRFELKAARC